MPSITDLLDEIVKQRMIEQEARVAHFILTEFFDGNPGLMMSSLEAHPGQYQLEAVPREDAAVVVTFRDLDTNRTADLVLEAPTIVPGPE
jgi:hypothetical protein